MQFTNVSFPIDFTFFPSVTAVTFDAPLNAPALMLVTAYDSVPTLIVSATFNVFAFLSNPVTWTFPVVFLSVPSVYVAAVVTLYVTPLFFIVLPFASPTVSAL